MTTRDDQTPTVEQIAALEAETIKRCVDFGCDDEEAGSHGETCRLAYGSDYERYCDPCLLSAWVTALHAAEARGEARGRQQGHEHCWTLPGIEALVSEYISCDCDDHADGPHDPGCNAPSLGGLLQSFRREKAPAPPASAGDGR